MKRRRPQFPVQASEIVESVWRRQTPVSEIRLSVRKEVRDRAIEQQVLVGDA